MADTDSERDAAQSSPGDLAARVVSTATSDIGSFIRSQRESAQVSLRQLAQTAGVSNPYLSQIERGLRKPSAEVLASIAKGLRVSSEVLYVRAGLLEERPHSPVVDAVHGDESITERQKHVLLEIYYSFRRENSDNAAEGETPQHAPTPSDTTPKSPTTTGE
ncbi:helix-turn-helix domain-containing protein [Rhodococcoides corynebacterioides]|uniref:Helix-turn-helix transcriptional regulator n=1 Tax=Rhodococcoides corynebacterioides TaxID=53972 RepID=A0ABS7P428_9NOCA|nr:helix-turn-helix transcriptional regulator [Rhodococcus corynebacterioides]MBY6367169.1 helix-turn-helix transcriptional regulator [Rhodococcus corynebacterioides]MBY6407417.1 helix-turn-helix transcriptional regulator [Rhodococcus corynebacterioides]